MADTITSYEGNANLGAGSNANIASPTDVRLFEGSNQAMSDAFKTINDTHKTIALMNFEFNQKIFAQKVKDRDTLIDMLDKGEAVIGNYRKEDKKHLDEAQKDYDEKFDKYYNKGINDRDAMREFKAAASKLKDVGTKLQIRYNHEQTEKGEIAKEPIIAKKEARQKALDESLNGDFDIPPKPYQQILDFNPHFNAPYIGNSLLSGSGDVPHGTSNIAAQSSILTPATSTSQRVTTTKQAGKPDKVVTTTAPAKETQQKGVEPIQGSIVTDANGMVYSVSKQFYDWNKIKANATTAFIDPLSQDHEMQGTLHRYMETQPKEVVEQHLKEIDQRVNDYNHDRGFDESDKKNYLDYGSIEKIATIDPQTGRYVINPKISIPEFAALDALAQVQGSYTPEQHSFLPDETKAMQAAQKEKDLVSHQKVMENIGWAKVNAYAKNMASQIKKRDTNTHPETIVENDFNKNASANFTQQGVDATTSIPIFGYDDKGNPKRLIPKGATVVYKMQSDGKTPVKDKQGQPIIEGYSGGHYERKYKMDNESLEPADLIQKYIDGVFEATGKKIYYKDVFNDKKINADFNNSVKKLLDGGIVDITLIGEGGVTADKKTQSSFILRNLKQSATKYGSQTEDEPIIEPSIDNSTDQ